MKIAACVGDIMDRSRFGGYDVTFVSGPDEVADVDLVIIDISRNDPANWAGLSRITRLVGYGSHLDRDRFDAARTAGFDEVLARSALFSRLDVVLTSPNSEG